MTYLNPPPAERHGPCAYLYRYDDNPYADPGDYYLWVFPVKRFTPKGCWVLAFGEEKFVLLTSYPGKRLGYVSTALALDSYIARKKRQIKIMSWKFALAKQRLQLAEDHKRLGHKPSEEEELLNSFEGIGVIA